MAGGRHQTHRNCHGDRLSGAPHPQMHPCPCQMSHAPLLSPPQRLYRVATLFHARCNTLRPKSGRFQYAFRFIHSSSPPTRQTCARPRSVLCFPMHAMGCNFTPAKQPKKTRKTALLHTIERYVGKFLLIPWVTLAICVQLGKLACYDDSSPLNRNFTLHFRSRFATYAKRYAIPCPSTLSGAGFPRAFSPPAERSTPRPNPARRCSRRELAPTRTPHVSVTRHATDRRTRALPSEHHPILLSTVGAPTSPTPTMSTIGSHHPQV